MSKLFEAMERKTTRLVQNEVRLVYASGGKAALMAARKRFHTTPTSIAFGEFAERYTGRELAEMHKESIVTTEASECAFQRDLLKTAYFLALRGVY